MFEDDDDEYYDKVMDEFEKSMINYISYLYLYNNIFFFLGKHQNMIEVAPNIFVDNIQAGPSNQSIYLTFLYKCIICLY